MSCSAVVRAVWANARASVVAAARLSFDVNEKCPPNREFTILVVDDDINVLEGTAAALGEHGYGVRCAAGGEEALGLLEAAAENFKPDLILVDLWMPGMDGLEFLAALAPLRAHGVTAPAIAVSEHGSVDVVVRAARLGAANFVPKPFVIDALLDAVGQTLGQQSAPKPSRPVTGGSYPGGEDGRMSSVPARRSSEAARERTLCRSVVAGGVGLHSGAASGLILEPLPPGFGIRFGRLGSSAEVRAHVDHVDSTDYATSLRGEGVVTATVEHLLAALHAYEITNLLIKTDGEVPIFDGSASGFCELIENAGVEEQDAELGTLTVNRRIRIGDTDRWIEIEPCDGFRVRYELEYPSPVGKQVYEFEMSGAQAFREEIAPARTFGFVDEIRALEDAGLGQGGRLSNFILIGQEGVVNTKLRFADELARHKILDIVGDTYLLGRPVRGRITAHKTGHAHNVALMRELRDSGG